jgi:hypothetical protein
MVSQRHEMNLTLNTDVDMRPVVEKRTHALRHPPNRTSVSYVQYPIDDPKIPNGINVYRKDKCGRLPLSSLGFRIGVTVVNDVAIDRAELNGRSQGNECTA